MTAFILRSARPEDAQALAAIHLAARRVAMPWLAVLHDEADVRGWMAGHVLPEQTVRVAEAGGRVVGYAALMAGTLEQLYVLPAWQGRGVGGALLEEAKRLSPAGLSLWVFRRNEAARAFYAARGFVAVEETDGSGNEEKEPDVRCVWRP